MPTETTSAPRSSVQARQLRVFERDRWLCRSCRRPVIFAPAMKLLAVFQHHRGAATTVPAYYHTNWSRKHSPLLDELGACIDHVTAKEKGGSNDFENLATLCSKCNMRKGTLEVAEHLQRNPPPRKIKAKYGEPTDWDGLSGLFITLANEHAMALSQTDREWLRALTASRSASQGKDSE